MISYKTDIKIKIKLKYMENENIMITINIQIYDGPEAWRLTELFLYYTMSLHKKWSFPLRIYLVNVTKSAGNC